VSDPGSPQDLRTRGLVHDLNNVLETIAEAAELISSEERWEPVTAAILRSVDRGRRLVGSYADQSRPVAELAVVLDRAATFLKDFLPHLPGTKVKLHIKVPPGLRIQGEANGWERVFMNLFLNAAEAMRERGGGEIHVNAALGEEQVTVRVQDDGPGIDEAILAKIFKARVSTRSRQTGLGLHIVRSIVESSGGSVAAANREAAAGAVFTLQIPLALPEAEPSED